MSDFKKEMSGLIHGANAKAGLYTALISMALGNLIPTLSDGFYFVLQARLRDKWKKGEISATKYWRLNTFYYYSIPCLYWVALALVVINIKGDASKKMKISLGAVGAGAVVAIIMKMIQNDKVQLLKEDEERLLLMQKHPEVVKVLKQPEFENIAGQLLGSSDRDSSAVDGGVPYVKLSREREAEQNNI